MLPLPTESDWRSEPWCLDAKCAYKNLSGKSHKQAVHLFRENALYYQENIMFMPFACFPFYANAYVEYLRSEFAMGDSDAANCFFGLIDVRMDDISNAGRPFIRKIIETLTYLSNNQRQYDADESIYGSFPEMAQGLNQAA